MVTLALDAPQLSRTRYAVCPLWEVGLAALVLRRGDPGALFERWVARSRRRVPAQVLDRIMAMTAGRSFVADVLSPVAGVDDAPDIRSALDRLLRVPDALLARDLERLDVAHRGADRWIRELIDGPATARDKIVAVVAEFWDGAIAPHWAAFERLAQADIARQGITAARAGQAAMFDQLHPRISFTGAALDIDGACETSFGPTPDGSGVLLVPSAFAWPDVHVMSNAPYQPAIAYGARGFAALWEPAMTPAPAVERLIGVGRTRVAAAISAAATTTEVAHALGIAAATASEHLRTLTDAGLAVGLRDGRTVVYSLTELGRRLLSEPPRR